MRLLVVAPTGGRRLQLIQNAVMAQNTTQNTTQSATQSATRSEQSDAVVVVSLQEDPEYQAYLANYMAKAAAMTVDEETGEPTEATEPVEPPLPETFVLPMLARLLRGKARCIVDGDPAVFTPAVVAAMCRQRLHPSNVLRCTMETDTCVERRLAQEFIWSPPPRPALHVPEDEDEDEEPPPPPTLEELKEMEADARTVVRDRLLAETEAR